MILVDTCVLIDVLSEDTRWYDWSLSQLVKVGSQNLGVINQVIFAELAAGGLDELRLDQGLARLHLGRLNLPYSAAAVAGLRHRDYRQRGGTRHRVLADFMIGAHAEVAGLKLLTRDTRRFNSYFPKVELISPRDA